MRNAIVSGIVFAALGAPGLSARPQQSALQLPPPTAVQISAGSQTPAGQIQAAGQPQAQPGSPAIKMGFDAAVAQAIARNPTMAIAATNITRAEAIVEQTRSAVLPTVSALVSNPTLNTGVAYQGATITPQSQVSLSGIASVPILAPSRWAAVTQSRDQVDVSEKALAESRQQIGVATAQAYLSIIAAKRQVDVEQRSLDNAQAHLDYAQKRLEGGVGSRLNMLRAAQEVSTEQTRLEAVRIALYNAQEALGVLVVENGPVDASEEPALEVPGPMAEAEWMALRPDIQFQQTVINAAERVVNDSWRDYMPNATAAFAPQYVTPSGIFTPSGSWRLTVALTEDIYVGGQRKAARQLRDVSLDQSRLQLSTVQIQARSDERSARESLASAERALVYAQQAVDQANQVLGITTQAFQVGATTNLEVIDAQREARDTDTARALAEDVVRRSKLDLLVALGKFPK